MNFTHEERRETVRDTVRWYRQHTKLGVNLIRLAVQKPHVWVHDLDVRGDRLAFRQYLLHREGLETLQNAIYGAHGLPNRY